MELRAVFILAAALLPAVVIAAPVEGAQHAIELQAVATPGRPTEAGYACHRGKGPAGYYGAETSDCDTPLSLVNATFDWIEEHLKDNIDFVIWTGDSARHDSDDAYDRSEKDVVRSNRMIADMFQSKLSDSTGLSIPVIPTFGNNDILPHNIMVGGPSKWLRWYTDIWKSFIPESQRHTFELGGWFFTEVIPNKLVVFSLNTLYFFNRNAGIDDCVHPTEPGFKQMEWLRIQLQFLRNRGMKAILMGHVPPARTSGKENWDETCWQKYTLWLQQYRDVIVGSLYGHMNMDHFILQDTRDINLNYLETSSKEYKAYVEEKKQHAKKPKLHVAGDVNRDGFYIRSGADYLTELRNEWAKLPKAAMHANIEDDFDSESKKKKKPKKPKKPKKHPLGGEWAERYQLSLVSPSIVPNYFPTIRVFEYNITGMEDLPTWRDLIRDSKPKQDEHVDFDAEVKKHKKGKKGKPAKDPYLIVPEPPATTAPPGPAYSPQPLTLTGYTQYYANLTYLNNDARDFIDGPNKPKKLDFPNDAQDLVGNPAEDELSKARWNEGVHKGKKPGHKPKPRPFQFEIEYSTFDDKLYKIKDLTVGNMVKLAYRIGQVGAKSKALGEDFEDDETNELESPQHSSDDEDEDEDEEGTNRGFADESDTGADDDDDVDSESHNSKKGKKKHKKRNKIWLHFLRYAFVSTASEKELKKVSPFRTNLPFTYAAMATNSGRGNQSHADADVCCCAVGASEGPSKVGEGAPPPLSKDVKESVTAGQADGAGVHAAGQDAATAPAETKVKSAKEFPPKVERERKKAEKNAKFAEKQKAKAAQADQQAQQAASKPKKEKAPKPVDEPLPPYVEDTPVGEKKRLKSLEDPHFKAYNPIAVESAWYEWWEKEGFFKPEFKADGKVKDEGAFTIVIPPPNVTGALHMMEPYAWQDDTMAPWMIDLVWKWKDEYHARINKAQRKMGGSTDWSREAFTMDKNLSAAVSETFVKLHEEGIIYRANRLVNWSTELRTALSNLEVINKELPGRTLIEVPGYNSKIEFGIIVHFKYPIEGSEETIEVATTRPETMLGDTGIAVHPDDDRYKHLIGKRAVHPFIPDRLMPIVADTYVDKEFGTGAVKITPAHDPNDFALGQRHKLEFINILTDDGVMNEHTGSFKGQKRFDVRYSIQEALKERGLYVDKKDNPMTVPICERSGDVIEPLLKPQWWMRMKELAEPAIAAVKDGRIKIKPETAERSYFRWMESINDWCLSRQLWWGHQCPVYFAQIEGETNDEADGEMWFAGRDEEEARAKAEKALPGKKFTLKRDEDVLDTWFSSGLWPFSTLGWPNKTPDLAKLYPTSLLETGWDILFFWIARMIMLGLKMVGDVPFKEVYCHSLVRDSEGRKMSKSLGNVIDPLDVISGIALEGLNKKLYEGNLKESEVEKAKKYQKTAFPDGIPECGGDALRFCMVNYTTGGGDINFDIKVMHAYRKFCNKIYQATKYVLGKLDQGYTPPSTGKLTGKESLAEQWILHKMNQTVKEVNEAMLNREFNAATTTIYTYWYNLLCDVFIENSKAIIQEGAEEEKRSAVNTLYTALDNALKLIHPFMPFLTEELWQRLPRRKGDDTRSIMIARYPVYDSELDNPTAEAAYELVLGSSKGIRSLMAEYALKDEAKVFVQTYNETAHKTAIEQVQSIKSLSGKGVTSIEVLPGTDARPAGCVAYPVSSAATVFLHVKGRVDIDSEIDKANKKLQKTRASIQKQQKLLNDKAYQEKADASLQEQDRKRLADFENEAKGFEGTIKQFEGLKLE
ncbi:putative valine--tRNA ligase [Seiridium unicorne]|uniref:valine--tRNA ligase n=1 Tax=Seiridium unicorne TaxID=138068 RepID=A0ABR2V5C5_9PEZI